MPILPQKKNNKKSTLLTGLPSKEGTYHSYSLIIYGLYFFNIVSMSGAMSQ